MSPNSPQPHPPNARSFLESGGASPSSLPVLPPLAFDDRAEGERDTETKHRRWWKPASRHDDGRSGRSASIRTTSTVSSASTVFSKGSGRSGSTAAFSNASEGISPVSPMSPSYRDYTADEAAQPPIPNLSALSLGVDKPSNQTQVAYQRPRTASNRHQTTLLARSDSRLESRVGHRSDSQAGNCPLAEVEMMPRKYAGYWRASFTAELPISAAMCGCLLMVAGPGEYSPRQYHIRSY